jgi:hypothetical protein
MTHWEFSHIPFDGELTDDKIVCQNCGWNWNVKDGGEDLYVCHKCNTDNSKYYLGTQNYSNADYSQAITQGVSAIGSIGSSVAQNKANKEAGKTNTQREVDAICGKDKSRALIKKKKNAYLNCKKNVLANLDAQRSNANEQKIKSQEILLKANIENQKNQRNRTYIAIGIVALVLGFIIYKKKIIN